MQSFTKREASACTFGYCCNRTPLVVRAFLTGEFIALHYVLPQDTRWRTFNYPRQPGLTTLEMETSPLRVLRGKERNVS